MVNKGIDLVEKIINNIPNDLNLPIEKARFIYIELGKLLEFNTTFHNTTNLNKFIIKNRHYDIYNIKDNQIVCHNWADIYVELLKQVGIKAHKVSKNHAWVLIEINDMLIYADGTIGSYSDLSRIKHNDEIINFYPVSSKKTEGLPQRVFVENFIDSINKIDQKIGYKKTHYELLQHLKEKAATLKTVEEKVDYLIKNSNIVNCGYYEEISYIEYIFSLCLTFDERKNIFMSDLKKTKEDKTVDIIKCISLLENDIYKYYIFQKNVGISETSKQDILNYANSNYGISKNNNCPDLNDYPLIFQVPKNTITSFISNIFTLQNKNLSKQKIKQHSQIGEKYEL